MPAGAKPIAYAAAVLVFLATWWHPRWPLEQAMHGSLTVVGFAWLAVHARRWPMGDGAFTAICLFLAVHSIAARWLYSNVPYDAWLRAVAGWSPQAAFGWHRNHADRAEWLEWGVALALAPGQAEAYNGQQGDPWDAHMDMLLATVGALVVLLCGGWRGAAERADAR